MGLQRTRLKCRRLWFHSWVGKIPWRRDRLPTPVRLGLPYSSAGKESCNVGDLGSIPGLRRSPGKGQAYPPVFWPGEFHGLDSLRGWKESDTTERLSLTQSCQLYLNKTRRKTVSFLNPLSILSLVTICCTLAAQLVLSSMYFGLNEVLD